MCGVDASGSEEGSVAGSCENDKAFGSKKNVAKLLTEDSLVSGNLPCSMALASQQ